MKSKITTTTKSNIQGCIAGMLMTIEELAEILCISKKTIYNRLSANDDMPPARKFGRKLLWLRTDVAKWIENLPLAA